MPSNPSPDLDPTAVAELYGMGMSINAIRRMLRASYSKIRRALEDQGVAIRPREKAVCAGARNSSSKLTLVEREALEAELRRGEKQFQQLSLEYGITRERVRQIARSVQAPCGREIQRRLRCERLLAKEQLTQQRAEARLAQQTARYKQWQDLWNQGLSLQKMAETLSMSPQSLGVRITELRKAMPGSFPYRRVCLSPEEKQRLALEKQEHAAQRRAQRLARREAVIAARKAEKAAKQAQRATPQESPVDSAALRDPPQP